MLFEGQALLLDLLSCDEELADLERLLQRDLSAWRPDSQVDEGKTP